MWTEIIGAVLLWVFGVIAIGEWFALAKLNGRYERLERNYLALKKEHLHVLQQSSDQK